MSLGLLPIDLCSNSIEGRINHNFSILDAIHKKAVKDIVATLPDYPNDKDSYILNDSCNYSIQVFIDPNWQRLEIETGQIYYVENSNNFVKFDSTGYSYMFSDDVLDIDSLPEIVSLDDNNNLIISDGMSKKINLQTLVSYIASQISSGSGGGDGVPVGHYGLSASTNIAPNWLLCDGREVSRSAYPELFAAIGTIYGQGDGGTSFNLPDARGRFPRGWAGGDTTRDPDRFSRVAMNTGGNTGDMIGSVQTQKTALPTNNFTSNTDGKHRHLMISTDATMTFGQNPEYINASNDKPISLRVSAGGTLSSCHLAKGKSEATLGRTNESGNHSHSITGGGDNQTCPENFYVAVVIKARP